MITNQSFATAYAEKGLSVFPLTADTLQRPEEGTSWKNDPSYLIGLNTSPLGEGAFLTTLHTGNTTINGKHCTILVVKCSAANRMEILSWIRQQNKTRASYDRLVFNPLCEARDGESSLFFYVVPHSLLSWQRKNSSGMELFYAGDRILLPSATTGNYQWVKGKEPTVDNLLSDGCIQQLSIVLFFIMDSFNMIGIEGGVDRVRS